MTERIEADLEKPQHACPSCEREFKRITDYPRVYVSSVSIATPDILPAAIPAWHREDLLEAPKEGWKRELVPQEVLTYFQAHPEEDSLIHADSYIYERPYTQTKRYEEDHNAQTIERSRQIDFYMRQFNYSPVIRKALESNIALQEYLDFLRQTTGLEVMTKSLFPNWDEALLPTFYRASAGQLIPGTDRLMLNIHEREENHLHQRAEIGIWTDGPNMGSGGGPTMIKLTTLGEIAYEGRINNP